MNEPIEKANLTQALAGPLGLLKGEAYETHISVMNRLCNIFLRRDFIAVLNLVNKQGELSDAQVSALASKASGLGRSLTHDNGICKVVIETSVPNLGDAIAAREGDIYLRVHVLPMSLEDFKACFAEYVLAAGKARKVLPKQETAPPKASWFGPTDKDREAYTAWASKLLSCKLEGGGPGITTVGDLATEYFYKVGPVRSRHSRPRPVGTTAELATNCHYFPAMTSSAKRKERRGGFTLTTLNVTLHNSRSLARTHTHSQTNERTNARARVGKKDKAQKSTKHRQTRPCSDFGAQNPTAHVFGRLPHVSQAAKGGNGPFARPRTQRRTSSTACRGLGNSPNAALQRFRGPESNGARFRLHRAGCVRPAGGHPVWSYEGCSAAMSAVLEARELPPHVAEAWEKAEKTLTSSKTKTKERTEKSGGQGRRGARGGNKGTGYQAIGWAAWGGGGGGKETKANRSNNPLTPRTPPPLCHTRVRNINNFNHYRRSTTQHGSTHFFTRRAFRVSRVPAFSRRSANIFAPSFPPSKHDSYPRSLPTLRRDRGSPVIFQPPAPRHNPFAPYNHKRMHNPCFPVFSTFCEGSASEAEVFPPCSERRNKKKREVREWAERESESCETFYGSCEKESTGARAKGWGEAETRERRGDGDDGEARPDKAGKEADPNDL